jgi:hypothetical protein
LELRIVLAEFPISLSKLVELRGSSSHLVGVAKGSLKNRDESCHIFMVYFVGEDVRLNLVLYIAFEEDIHVAEYVVFIDVSCGFSSKFQTNIGDKIKAFLAVPSEISWVGQFDWLSYGQAGMVGRSLHHTNCSIHTCKVTFEVYNSAGIV